MAQNRNQTDFQQGGGSVNVQQGSGQRTGRQGRGFAGMDPARQREIASKGGKAAHEKGTAHEFTSEEARVAGRKGGEVVSQNREHMATIGREGGQARGNRHRSTPPQPIQGEYAQDSTREPARMQDVLSGDESLSRDDGRAISEDETRAIGDDSESRGRVGGMGGEGSL